MAPAVAKNVKGVVSTSSPRPMSSARRESSRASVPFAQPTAWVVCENLASSRSRRSTGSPRMNAWSSTTFMIAFATESRIVACCAFRSRSGTAIYLSQESEPEEPLKIHESRSYLSPKRQWNLPTGLGRFVDTENQLQRLPPRAAVSVGLGLAPQHRQDVSVVTLMPEPVDIG